MPPSFTILVSFASALIAGAFTQWLAYRLNERQRRLELYKIVYPEKFKAIKEFMARAYDLQIEVINAHGKQIAHSDREDLKEKIKQFSRDANAQRWLFGKDVMNAVVKIRDIMMRDQFNPTPSADLDLSAAIDAFNDTIDKELQITTLSNTFKQGKKSWPFTLIAFRSKNTLPKEYRNS